MRHLTYVGPNLREWWDAREPRLQDDRDAIVAPLAVTRCDLDLSIATGVAGFEGPFAIGHEAAGVVTAGGDSRKNVAPRDKGILPFHISCGQCDPCPPRHTHALTPVPLPSSD